MIDDSFEAAWDVTKSPIIPDSIKDVKDKFGMKRRIADFDHDITGRSFPMKLNPYSLDVKVFDEEPNTWDDNEIAEARYQTRFDNRITDEIIPSRIDVDEDYRRLGIGSAMNDLMAHYLSRDTGYNDRFPQGYRLVPSMQQSEAAAAMWSKMLNRGRAKNNPLEIELHHDWRPMPGGANLAHSGGYKRYEYPPDTSWRVLGR
jgi:hypothetical protein